MPKCDLSDCAEDGEIISRLSPDGFFGSNGKKAYSFREAYRRFHYCKKCHDQLMANVWTRVRKPDDKGDDHPAPTMV